MKGVKVGGGWPLWAAHGVGAGRPCGARIYSDLGSQKNRGPERPDSCGSCTACIRGSSGPRQGHAGSRTGYWQPEANLLRKQAKSLTLRGGMVVELSQLA